MKINRKTYDTIIVLAMQLDPQWNIRPDLQALLDMAVAAYHENPGAKIVVSGRWSIWYDWVEITPPITEAFAMKKYLLSRDIPAQDVLMENRSKDTVGNAYYSTRLLRTRPDCKNLLIISAKQHQERVKFLFRKFFGDDYNLDFAAIPSRNFKQYQLPKTKVIEDRSEAEVLQEQITLLHRVRTGEETDFSHQLYKSRYYTQNPTKALLAKATKPRRAIS